MNFVLAGKFRFPSPFLQINEGFSLEEAVPTTEENVMEIVTCNFNDTKHANPDHKDIILGVSENGVLDYENPLNSENSSGENGVNILLGQIDEDIDIDTSEETLKYPKVFDTISKVFDKPEKNDSTEDESSDDETESEDEFMPDGEPVRKGSRGFKQLVNCKKFWMASQMVGKRRFNF